MAAKKNLRWGIAGTGYICQDFCTALKYIKTEAHSITAVSDRSLEEAKRFSETYSITNFYDSHDQLCENGDVDIVYVGTVNSTHKEICLKAIECGKHVLCEKPMSLNSIDQNEVFEAAKNKGVFLMEGLMTRFFPVVIKIKEELDKKRIGEVTTFTSTYTCPNKEIERIRSKELGGGSLLDLGIFTIHLACLVFNDEKPTEIISAAQFMPTGVDEACAIILKYSNNKMAVLNVSTNCRDHSPSAIIGDEGIIQIPFNSRCPTIATFSDGDIHENEVPQDQATIFTNGLGLMYEIEAVREAIEKGLTEHPLLPHKHSQLIMSIIDEVKKQITKE